MHIDPQNPQKFRSTALGSKDHPLGKIITFCLRPTDLKKKYALQKKKNFFFFFFLENRSNHVKGIAKLSQIFSLLYHFVKSVRYTILERFSHLQYLLCQQALTEQKGNMLFMLLVGGNTNVISDYHFMGIWEVKMYFFWGYFFLMIEVTDSEKAKCYIKTKLS